MATSSWTAVAANIFTINVFDCPSTARQDPISALKSSETGAQILRKPFCQIQPMGQQNMGTVRTQDLSVPHIFKRHREPLLVALEARPTS